MRSMFSKSRTQAVVYRTKHLRTENGTSTVTARQEKLSRFSQKALRDALVYLIGAGGLGGEIGEALVRKGVGELVILDDDVVEVTNLNRQRFYAADLGKYKAVCLARNLANEGFCRTVIRGYALRLEEAIAQGIDLSGSVAVCGIDNTPGRVAASTYFRSLSMPVVFTAVSETANNGYTFVQEASAESPCFGCMFTDAIVANTYPCATPAVKDILKVVAGITVYAVDTLLMQRPRSWHYKDIFLDGSIPGRDWPVARRADCTLCGSGQEETPGGTKQ
jgi:molybdopterin/thiamine biosynthesis adenylyltransferase